MTFSLLLNDAGDFEGGGTFFEEDGRVYRPQQGVAVLHSGKRRHGGYPISSGLTHTTPSWARLLSLSLSIYIYLVYTQNRHGHGHGHGLRREQTQERADSGESRHWCAEEHTTHSLCTRLLLDDFLTAAMPLHPQAFATSLSVSVCVGRAFCATSCSAKREGGGDSVPLLGTSAARRPEIRRSSIECIADQMLELLRTSLGE